MGETDASGEAGFVHVSALESGYDPTARRLVVSERYSGIQRAWTRPSTARDNMIHINGRRMRRLVWQIKLVAAGGIFLLNVDEPCLCPGIELQQSRRRLRRKSRCLRLRRSARCQNENPKHEKRLVHRLHRNTSTL